MLLIGGAAWWSAARSAETFRWVDHTHAVLYRLEATQTKLLVLQSDSRGYALTANEELLRTYDTDEAATRENLHGLRQAVADNPGQLQRLDGLEPLVTRVIELFRERIALRRSGGLAAVTKSRANTLNQPLMEQIMERFDEMEVSERRLLAERSAVAQADRRQAVLVFGLGSLVAIVVVVAAGLIVRRDFMRRREAEAALRQNEIHTRLMIDSVRDYAILMLDPGGRIVSWNNGAQRLKGYTAEEIIGRHFSTFYPAEAVGAGVPDRALRLAAAHGRFEDEGWRIRRDGSRFLANVVINALRNPAGELLGFVKVTRDFTERKKTEDRIRELNLQLSTQNQNLRAIFESLPGLCLVLSPELVIVAATDAYLKATMTEREKISGRHLFDVFPDNPDDPGADGVRNLRISLERVQKLQQADTMAIQKYDVRRPDGLFEERYWSPINSPVFGSDRRLEYIIHRVEDVTDFVRQKKASPAPADETMRTRLEKMEAEVFQGAQQIQLANQRLHAANAELEAFSYSVSHDLRAPLRHIDGFASLLQKNSSAALNDQGRRYLATISDSARQMGRLIDDLLSFSRMGRAALQPREVEDHDALVATIIRDGHWDRADRPITWQIARLPRVRADQAMLQQVWANLLDNAVKYSGKVAAPRIEVGTREDPATGEQVFFVRDNGAGFDMRYVDKLFGVFQRLHGPTEFEGTGIGLANVRRIILRHGGRTWAEGAPGQGATFYFSLPATSTPAAA